MRAAAKQYGWDTRPSPRKDQAQGNVAVGRGFAYRQLAGTYIALIAEVRVHRDTGVVEIPRIVVAHDCGLIVNPETIKHVIDRQLVWQTSRTMYEEVQFDENMVTSVDWLTYPVLKMAGVPKSVEIVTIDRPDQPSGAAEMACRPAPGRHRQCGVRCDRRAAAARALYARAREGRFENARAFGEGRALSRSLELTFFL